MSETVNQAKPHVPSATARSRSALFARVVVCLLFCSVFSCTNAVQSGRNTALDGTDLVQMTDDMAMKLAGDPEVQRAIADRGALRVVVQPVVNMMEAEVLPRGQADAFTGRVRTLLSRHAPDRFQWVMNRDAWYSLRDQELKGIDPGPSPEAVNPEFALTAKFESLTNETGKARSASYLCIYELTSLQDRTVLWSDRYEVKKTIVKGFLD